MNNKMTSLVVLISCGIAVACSPKAPQINFEPRALVKTDVSARSVEVLDDGVVLIDFGKDAFAQLSLSIRSSKFQVVKVRLGELLDGGRINRNPGGTIRFAEYDVEVQPGEHSYGIEYRPDPRNTRTTPVESGAKPILMPVEIGEVYPFRYVEVEGLDGEVLADGTRQSVVHYPFNDDASLFESSDTVLNAVWDLCKYSIKATSFCGCYIDGDRERIPYEGDAVINQLSHYAVDSEYALARHSVAYLFENPTWPTEWQLDMVICAWNDYLFTGDTALLEKYYDVIKAKTLCALREANGLISTCTGKITTEFNASINYRGTDPVKDIVDWPRSGSFGIGKKEAGEADGYVLTDYNTAVNAMHYGAVKYMVRIATALGKKADAAYFDNYAKEFLPVFNSSFFDEAKGVYKDGLDTDHCSLHANMFPLLFGMVADENKAGVLKFIRSRGMACSVYGSQFLLDALYEAGDAEYALSLLNSTSLRSWYNMIRFGSTITMEAWDLIFKPNLDLNHAWGASPANIIQFRLVGVRPLEPGFSRVAICPQPASLRHFKSVVPSPRGGIGVEMDNVPGTSVTAKISIPAGVSAEVSLPMANVDAVASLKVNGKPFLFSASADGKVSFKLGAGDWVCEVR